MHYTLCDMFSDLTENSVDAGAMLVTVEFSETESELAIRITDNGKGMSAEQLAKATDPFWTDGIKHPGRKIGLGIPFLIQTAELCGGNWKITSNDGSDSDAPRGTVLEARFDLKNIDTPPVGDVTGYFRQILCFNRPYELVIVRRRGTEEYTVKRSELLEALGLSEQGLFEDADSLALLAQYLEANETA